MDTRIAQIRNIGVIPVVKLDDAARAAPLARALKDGGIPAAEITFRTAAAEAAIKAAVSAVPDALIGAGTVTSVEMAKTALAAGAAFIVCPGFDPAVVDFCLAQQAPVFPGVSTPTEIMAAQVKGLTCLKFFPAEQAGGAAMLNALAGPFPDTLFIPTGGVSEANLGGYLKLKNVVACGGSWMVKPELVAAGDWAGISALCRSAVRALHGFEFAHVGINAKSEADAIGTAVLLGTFGFSSVPGSKSIFSGAEFETMKQDGRGTKGHIGIRTRDVERALAYLGKRGFKPVMETASYTGEAGKTPLKIVYLDKEISGFAFHLVRA
ncbi:bifunctional 4-hydroxy-2-oxoglutarate aldolase/2-dehydro-3-deoxy-phosphogluconate aldolase [Treponema endosymbiont of Eucomonympha sp.]|uniref:bifunctional 4-hydroxy-2-oxoglutarate aldolase/2-dehydro-3-deoxy-phosphogluconate aldolase n=1 Tax=Treponema endosymbiont of Eucomonympha sp. TaxID=1580831 RepID=UPI000783497F|nr:bifunctional 4-hydroxy-2-oxoglutarate aldolase/2-dehydro-3-deoxy-phosphogluconate aldolase [Treponema endosymbiont of Eucomonympha sp.]